MFFSLVTHSATLILLYLCGILSIFSIALSQTLQRIANFLLLLHLWKRMNRRKGIKMLSIFSGAFSQWGIYLKLGIPGAIMTVAEFWIFEVMTILSAYVGNTALATMSVVNNIISMSYSIAAGLSSALTSLVGRLLGEERVGQAKKVAMIGFAFHFINMTLIIVLLTVFTR